MTTLSASIPEARAAAITIQLVGGPTVVFEIGGVRLLTDPTFDPPGDHRIGERNLIKTGDPALSVDEIGHLDAVLLSHDQHPDNLDDQGRKLIERVPLVLTTAAAAQRLGGTTRELPIWSSQVIARPDGGELKITGVPAQHGPTGTEHITGEVRGFVVSGAGLPTVYISGDNVSLAIVRDVADHAGPIDIAVLFAGRARSPLIDAYLTLSAEQAAEAANILGSPVVIPIHVDGWAHLTQDASLMGEAFARHGLAERLLMLTPGAPTTIPAPGHAG